MPLSKELHLILSRFCIAIRGDQRDGLPQDPEEVRQTVDFADQGAVPCPSGMSGVPRSLLAGLMF